MTKSSCAYERLRSTPTSGTSSLGDIPYFLWLILLSRFVKQLGGLGQPMLTKKEAIATLRELLETGTIRRSSTALSR